MAAVEAGAVNCEVTLKFSGGNNLAAVIAKESVKPLGLKAGESATAIVKANVLVSLDRRARLCRRLRWFWMAYVVAESCVIATKVTGERWIREMGPQIRSPKRVNTRSVGLCPFCVQERRSAARLKAIR